MSVYSSLSCEQLFENLSKNPYKKKKKKEKKNIHVFNM